MSPKTKSYLTIVAIVVALLASFFLARLADAQTFGNHSGPVDVDAHGSVVNSHSSDGNTSAAAHAGQSMTGGDVDVITNSRTRILSGAPMPDFSPRGECSGSEGSAQAGTAGTFFGFSFGSTDNDPCHVREDLLTLATLAEHGFISEAAMRELTWQAIPKLRAWSDMMMVVEEGEHYRIVKFVPIEKSREWDPAFARFRD